MIHSVEEIAELAEFIAEENMLRGGVSLDKIASREDILVCPGCYGNCFTGMLRHVSGEFQIFLNLDKLRSIKYSRSRFTFAHELGHYFIDQHRKTLKAGLSLSYDRDLTYFSNNPVEKEANHFATNLLMPKQRFIADASKLEIGAEAIRELAKKYKTSLTSTAIQYRNLIDYPCTLLFWNRNRDFKKNYSDSWYNLIKPFSQNFNMTEQVKSEIFDGFDYSRLREKTITTSSLSSFYPDITFNGRKDAPVRIETLNLQSYGYISLIYIHQ